MDSEQQTVYAWNLFIALGNWTPLIQLQCSCSREMRHLSVLQSLLSSLHIDWSVNKITVTRKLSCLSSTRENYTDCYNTSKMMKRTKLICVTTVLSSPVSGDNFWSSLVVENHLLLCPIKYLLPSDSSFVFRSFWSVFFFIWVFLLTILADQVCVFIDYFGWPNMCFYWLLWLTKYVFYWLFIFIIDYTVDTRYLDIGYLDIPDMLTYL